MASNAVPSEFVSRVVGYNLTAGDFSNVTPNLPQKVLILAEGNTANQGSMPSVLTQITSDKEAGELFGYGSPIESIARILYPNSGIGIGGIPVFVGAQVEPVGAAAETIDVTVTGTATKNATHQLIINGRSIIDGERYSFNIASGDSPTDIAGKVKDAINNVLRSPVTAANTLGVVTATTKWAGATANDVIITVDTGIEDAGITYSVLNAVSGVGSPTVTGELNKMGDEWFTIVISGYGMDVNTMAELEAFNGKPDPALPTGRYSGIVFKPFIAICGDISDNASSITDLRLDELTIAVGSAPNSEGMHYEAAANYGMMYARQAQDSPERDIAGMVLPDMPFPLDGDIGTMSSYLNRDLYVKSGCTTVDKFGTDSYKVMDFVTTYHPVGETPPSFRYVRSLTQDFNVRFGYLLLEEIHVVDHVISDDNAPVVVSGVIKPKMWLAILHTYSDNLVARALIVDSTFMKDSLVVSLSTSNPERLDTFFRYKRSGFARILSTTAEAGFNFGTL